MSLLTSLYHRLFDEETRLRIFKLRNPEHFARMRTAVNPSDKGDFSLRAFDQHHCIFIHITKSAGTSVALALFGELPYHRTAWEYRVLYGRKTFDAYTKFAFVRNPWDRLYSAFSYLKGGGWNDDDRQWADTHLSQFDDFENFVLNGLNADTLNAHIHFKPQLDFIADKRGQPMIDHLLYFETIRDDFDKISNIIGLDATLEHRNSSKRSSYRDVYTPQMIEHVARIYAQDIATFGYEFSGIGQRKHIAERQWQG